MDDYETYAKAWSTSRLDVFIDKERKYKVTEQAGLALTLYIEKGIPPGPFLTAVICNDLMSAVSHADTDNIKLIPSYVKYLFNEAPGDCWGSPEIMQTYMRKKRKFKE
jgi:hypothetical protein